MPKLNKLLDVSQILQFLDLRSTNLTDAGLTLLCEGLILCPTLFNLNLAKNDITVSGIEVFAPILYRTGITELDLSLNPLGNNGVRCLSENLWEKVYINNSILGLENYNPDKYTHGKKCSLLKLDLSETKMQEIGAYNLFKNLTEYYQLQQLILDHNVFEVHKMQTFPTLVKTTRLSMLSLNYCKIGDSGGVSLGESIPQSSSMIDLRAK